MKKIVMTGGGSAGHVTPNLALVDRLRAAGYEIIYIGGAGIERQLVIAEHIPFYEISTGKLRRYESDAIWVDPTAQLHWRPLRVLVDPQDPDKYHIDLSDIVDGDGGA